MKKYLSFFRLRFITGLQYRTAALAGIATQFFWELWKSSPSGPFTSRTLPLFP